MSNVVLTDINGNAHVFDQAELRSQLNEQDFRFLGIGVEAALEFSKQYKMRGGRMPITADSINELYEPQLAV